MQKLMPGYALRSTRKYPREPDMVMVTQSDCDNAKFSGNVIIPKETPSTGWIRFKVTGKSVYYFQFRPR